MVTSDEAKSLQDISRIMKKIASVLEEINKNLHATNTRMVNIINEAKKENQDG